jgi:hypothetical protein
MARYICGNKKCGKLVGKSKLRNVGTKENPFWVCTDCAKKLPPEVKIIRG